MLPPSPPPPPEPDPAPVPLGARAAAPRRSPRKTISIVVAVIALSPCLACLGWLALRPQRPAGPDTDAVPEVVAALRDGREPDPAILARYATDPVERYYLRYVLGFYHRLDLLTAEQRGDDARAAEELAHWLEVEGVEVSDMLPVARARVRHATFGEVHYLAFAYRTYRGTAFADEGWMVGIAGPTPEGQAPNFPAWTGTHSNMEPYSREAIASQFATFASLTGTSAPSPEDLHIEPIAVPPATVPPATEPRAVVPPPAE